jgi:hypothetical protein
MRIRAQVLTPSNNTIASSMIESLRWCHQSMRAGREIVIIQFRPRGWAEPFYAADENVLKQSAVWLVVNKTGTADMQLIFDLIWNLSRSRFLATIHAREAEQ